MGTRDPRIDAYIAKSAPFAQPILKHLRAQVHTHCPECSETIKWGMPHFDYKGGIFANMAAFKAHCAFGFWLGDALKIDAKNEKAMGDFGRIRALADLPADKELARLIKAAMKLHDAGVKLPARDKPKETQPLEIPPAFMAALKKNKKALATFEAFTPGRKKEYVAWYVEAKSEDTRARRLAQAVEWMAEGKARNWKYEKC
ncbi:MAG TPA: YdeI/OmpD-associated family protein [Usitatibacteraceae bacterium]|nr:YdeI/OmpD-associated family protein [Usitatibacteraceae bacterium]